MAKALFTKKEIDKHEAKVAALKWNRDDGTPWNEYWSQVEALRRAHLIEQVRRAQARPEDFLNGLITLVGKRGGQYIVFEHAFASAGSRDIKKLIKDADTPETRRSLYTILQALTEVPKSWATSAFVRFLRGTGKQKGSKYHGAGTFGSDYDWKEREVKGICDVMIGGHNPYSKVLVSYADVEQEIRDAPDYEIIDYDTQFKATRVERDVEFIEQLCKMLEARGLGPIPSPKAKKAKKARKPKNFKPGDIVRKSTLRDLPLPAHVRIPIERYDEPAKQWVDATLEQVVIEIGTGRYHSALIQPGTKRAYPDNPWAYKDDLYGATFLGKWEGSVAKKKKMKLKYRWRAKRG
jgi:hypothetical protein